MKHTFKKVSGSVYLFPVYVRDDGQFFISSVDRRIDGVYRRVYEVSDYFGSVVAVHRRLRDAKVAFEL